MRFVNGLLAAVLCLACSSAFAESPGQFITAGPTNAEGSEIAVQWRFGFHFTIAPETISEVSFSCAPIPGSSVTVKAADLKVDAQGNTFALAAPTPMTKDATPWLFDNTTTAATCKAQVITTSGERLEENAPLHFAPSTKAALVYQFGLMFQFNSPPTSGKK